MREVPRAIPGFSKLTNIFLGYVNTNLFRHVLDSHALLHHSFRNVYRSFYVVCRVLQTHSISSKRRKKWRNWVSIPVPPAGEAGALPFELIPHQEHQHDVLAKLTFFCTRL